MLSPSSPCATSSDGDTSQTRPPPTSPQSLVPPPTRQQRHRQEDSTNDSWKTFERVDHLPRNGIPIFHAATITNLQSAGDVWSIAGRKTISFRSKISFSNYHHRHKTIDHTNTHLFQETFPNASLGRNFNASSTTIRSLFSPDAQATNLQGPTVLSSHVTKPPSLDWSWLGRAYIKWPSTNRSSSHLGWPCKETKLPSLCLVSTSLCSRYAWYPTDQ